jgi:hypothetical protein
MQSATSALLVNEPAIPHCKEPPPRDEIRTPLLAQSSYVADLYGTSQPHLIQEGGGAVALDVAQKRRMSRMTYLSILIPFLLPWALFSALFATRSFSFHYYHTFLARAVTGSALVMVLGGGALAAHSRRRESDSADGRHETAWGIFIAATCFLAWVLAVVGGDLNFYRNMQPYYDILNLSTYPAVDPAQTSGQQVMDAGRIVFHPTAKLDVSKAMGLKDLDTYCVAPVTLGSSEGFYDFWAVGVNCCSGGAGDFHCGEFNNPYAHAGLRLMQDAQRPFFRLAVQQAEATHGIKAEHPIFLHWMQDPNSEVYTYGAEGFRNFFVGTCTHFVLQWLLVGAYALFSCSSRSA